MKIIKKIALLLACVLVIGMVAGCASQPADLLSVVYKKNKVVRLGDNRGQVEKITGTAASMITEFEDGVYRYSYWDVEGLDVDYLGDASNDNAVVALRISNSDWKLASGITIGSEIEKAKSAYDKDLYVIDEQYNGVYIAFDAEGKPTRYLTDSPYQLLINADENGVIDSITLQNNQ